MRIRLGSIEIVGSASGEFVEIAGRSGVEHKYLAELMPGAPGLTLAALRPRGAGEPYCVSFTTGEPACARAAALALLSSSKRHHEPGDHVSVRLGDLLVEGVVGSATPDGFAVAGVVVVS